MSIAALNPQAETSGDNTAFINYKAAEALQNIIKSCFGPKGQYKMLVSGSGDVKITKDGKCLLSEMSIIHPTASLISRGAMAQVSDHGDGSLGTVLILTEMLKSSYRFISQGTHPNSILRDVSFTFQLALEELSRLKSAWDGNLDVLKEILKTSLQTKLHLDIAELTTGIICEAFATLVTKEGEFDSHMIEIIKIAEGDILDSYYFKGLVLDHGGRHPLMPKALKNCHIMILNVSLEYEKTEVNSGFFYGSVEERKALVESEKKFIDERVRKIIEFKRNKLGPDSKLVIVNQKGIDPRSLEQLSNEGILALRRAKRRNMERLEKICGGKSLNSLEDLCVGDLGFSEDIYEISLGEEKMTFVKGSELSTSGTIVLKGSIPQEVEMVKDCVKKAFDLISCLRKEPSTLPGGGYVCEYLVNQLSSQFSPNNMGFSIFSESLSIIHKSILLNYGAKPSEHGKDEVFDAQQGKYITVNTSDLVDSYSVWKNMLSGSLTVYTNIMKIDEMINAGKQIKTLKE